MTVPDGTPLDEATSALIKELRRARELHALYWAAQIETKFPLYVWRRLGIFASEDCGLANPQSVVVIASLRQVVELIRSESRSPRADGSLLAMGVLYLARSPKSRECDDAINVLAHLIEDEGWRPAVPEYAIDLHTARGRGANDEDAALRRWFESGSVVEPASGPADWLLAHRRWAARHGYLDRAEVERQAVEWAEAGRLVFGVGGYSPEGR